MFELWRVRLRRADRDVSALQEELRLYEVDKKRLAEVGLAHASEFSTHAECVMFNMLHSGKSSVAA